MMGSVGDRAWLGLAAYVVGYDVWAARYGRDTLSESFGRAVHDSRRWPTVVFWAFLVGHLFRMIPDSLDPLRNGLARVPKK